MPGKRKVNGKPSRRPLLRNYLREWREHRGLTLEQLAERANLSLGTVSGVELYRVDFTGKTLRQLAEALETTAASLIAGPPSEDGEIWSIWDELGRQDRHPEAVAILRALRDTKKS